MVLLEEVVVVDIFLLEVHQNQECLVVQEVVDHHHQEWEAHHVVAVGEVEAVVSEVEEEVILVEVTIVVVVVISVDGEWIEAAEEDLGEDLVEVVQVVEVLEIVGVEEVVGAVAVAHRKEEVDHQARADLQKGQDLISHLHNLRMVMQLNRRVKVDMEEVPVMLMVEDNSNHNSNRR